MQTKHEVVMCQNPHATTYEEAGGPPDNNEPWAFMPFERTDLYTTDAAFWISVYVVEKM